MRDNAGEEQGLNSDGKNSFKQGPESPNSTGVPSLQAAMERGMSRLLDESPALIPCLGMFLVVYVIGFYGLFTSWKRKARLDAASCCMSMIHGTFATLLTSYEALRSAWILDAPNTDYQNWVMEFSIAYFLMDLLHYILFVPGDYIFILHHLATTTYMLSCRYYTRHGAMSVMLLLGLAEVTAPVQNIWTLARAAREESPLARSIYQCVSPFFTVLFTIVRGILGPCLTWKLCQYYLSGNADAVIPRWLAAYWMITVILAISGSLLWVSSLWVGFIHFLVLKQGIKSKLSKAE